MKSQKMLSHGFKDVFSTTPLHYPCKARGFIMGCWCMLFLWSKKSLEITNYQPTCGGPCQYFFQSDYLLFPIGCSPKQSCFVLLKTSPLNLPLTEQVQNQITLLATEFHRLEHNLSVLMCDS